MSVFGMCTGREEGLTHRTGAVDFPRPALGASLEYLKYCAGKHLPSQFMEAEMDYFGAHSYDLKSEGPGEVQKGACWSG